MGGGGGGRAVRSRPLWFSNKLDMKGLHLLSDKGHSNKHQIIPYRLEKQHQCFAKLERSSATIKTQSLSTDEVVVSRITSNSNKHKHVSKNSKLIWVQAEI